MTKNIDQIVKNAVKRPNRRMSDFEFEQAYGKEPEWKDIKNTDANFRTLILDALNWANGVLDKDQYKQEVLSYLFVKNRSIDNLQDLPTWRFMEAGKIAWLYNNGCPLTEILLERLESKIKILNEVNDSEEEVIITDAGEVIVQEEKPKISRAEFKARLQQNKISELIALIDDTIDESIVNEAEMNESIVYHKLGSDKVDLKVADELYERLMNKHKMLIGELDELQKLSEEEQIAQFDDVETFQDYASNLEDNINNIVSVTNQVASYLGNKKALKKSERKIGKHKAKRLETQISKMNFKVQDETYKVMSINPTAVVGAMTLLVFNTHTRKLSIYVAKDDVGLSVKGTTIQNFDEVVSTQKIVKKPEMLTQFQEGNIRRLKVLFKDNIRAKEAPVNGRINEHTILLKVYKEKYSPSV